VQIERFLQSLESDQGRYTYRVTWRRWVDWCAREGVEPIKAVPTDVLNYMLYLTEAKQAKSSRALALSVIRSVYDHFVVYEKLAVNPARSVKNPRVILGPPKAPWLKKDELIKFALSVRETPAETWRERRDRLCVLLMIGIGWRRTEVARIQLEDLVDGEIFGTVKGGKRLQTGVPGWLQDEIASWVAFAGLKSGPLFPNYEGRDTAMTASCVYDATKAAARRAGFPEMTPHGLRRTYITLLKEGGIDTGVIQRSVGHASARTTERYIKTNDVSAPGEILEELVYGKR
jgi:integrase/recombinase XerD